MKRASCFFFIPSLLLAAFVHSTAAAPLPAKVVLYKVGVATRRFIPPEPFDWRGAKTHALITDIWYPADPTALEMPQWIGSADSPFASAGKAAPDAPILAAPARFPLILLSHGTGASSKMMAWLATALASHGFIAAAVNHPGNNALEDYTLQGFSLWWERAGDLSVVLNQLLADSTFGGHIDPKRVGAAGFSLGGYTVIELAGGIGELSRAQNFCKSPKADGMCADPLEFPGLSAKVAALAKSDPTMQAALLDGTKSHRDPRIRAIFAMAPALGPAFSPESLAKIISLYKSSPAMPTPLSPLNPAPNSSPPKSPARNSPFSKPSATTRSWPPARNSATAPAPSSASTKPASFATKSTRKLRLRLSTFSNRI